MKHLGNEQLAVTRKFGSKLKWLIMTLSLPHPPTPNAPWMNGPRGLHFLITFLTKINRVDSRLDLGPTRGREGEVNHAMAKVIVNLTNSYVFSRSA